VNCRCRSVADIWPSRSWTGPVSSLPVTCFYV